MMVTMLSYGVTTSTVDPWAVIQPSLSPMVSSTPYTPFLALGPGYRLSEWISCNSAMRLCTTTWRPPQWVWRNGGARKMMARGVKPSSMSTPGSMPCRSASAAAKKAAFLGAISSES